MRRPSPLPPPPPAAEPRGTAATRARVAEPDDLDETAPIEPLWFDEAVTRRPDEIAPVLPLTADADTADDDRVGVRDVWAAARARRRTLRAEVRRFTARQRRRRMVWVTVGVSLAALILGTLGAAYSPLFAVQKVSVVGASTLDAAAVEAALGDQLGTPLPLVDSSEVKAALVAFPLVESYAIEARPPHELIIRIVERTPIGSVPSAAGWTLVDAAGVALSTTPEPPADHPTLEIAGGVGSKAFHAAGTVFRALPDDIRSQVTGISATTANDVTLTLGGTDTTVVWGNADDSARKAVVLTQTMLSLPPSEVDTYDVSSPAAVVVR